MENDGTDSWLKRESNKSGQLNLSTLSIHQHIGKYGKDEQSDPDQKKEQNSSRYVCVVLWVAKGHGVGDVEQCRSCCGDQSDEDCEIALLQLSLTVFRGQDDQTGSDR